MKLRTLLIVACAMVLAACNSEHSVLSPHGTQARQIAHLAWILVAMLCGVSAIVFTALFVAMRGGRLRTWLSDRRAVVAGGIVFPTVVLTCLLAYGIWLMRSDPVTENAIRIDVTGEQWWWRVRYQTADGRVVERANDIRMPVGERVQFSLRSADVIHSFWIPSLGGKVDMIPGRTNAIELSADKVGRYRGICAEYCGGAHAFMMFDVTAVPPDDFKQWLGNDTVPVPPSRGQALFEAAGCGACHAIDGSPAKGKIGPNLNGLGTRRHIGAGRLPMTKENLLQFVADSSMFKPGSRMPPFKFLPSDDLADIVAYIMDLP